MRSPLALVEVTCGTGVGGPPADSHLADQLGSAPVDNAQPLAGGNEHNPIAASPTGTLIQNTDRQPNPSTSTPPSSGPTSMLSPTTPPHTPIARARARGSVNVLRGQRDVDDRVVQPDDEQTDAAYGQDHGGASGRHAHHFYRRRPRMTHWPTVD
jgi:hypothetical protein